MISHGAGGLARGPLPEGMIAVGDCDHSKLFPRMAAVVHHGGAGTTATAARAGAPPVIVSHLNEQHGWGRRTHQLSIGVQPIPRSKLSAARLGAAITLATTDPSLARDAKVVATRLCETDPLENAMRELRHPTEGGRHVGGIKGDRLAFAADSLMANLRKLLSKRALGSVRAFETG